MAIKGKGKPFMAEIIHVKIHGVVDKEKSEGWIN